MYENLVCRLEAVAPRVLPLATHPRMIVELPDLASMAESVWAIGTDPLLLAENMGVSMLGDLADNMSYSRGRLVYVSRLIGVPAIGCFPAPGSPDTRVTPPAAVYSYAVGFRGALCRDWTEVRVANSHYRPTDHTICLAERTLAAMESAVAEGRAAASLDGRMIDLPFVKGAQKTLAIADRMRARDRIAAELHAKAT